MPYMRAEASRSIEVTGVPEVKVPWELILSIGLGLAGLVAIAVIISRKKS